MKNKFIDVTNFSSINRLVEKNFSTIEGLDNFSIKIDSNDNNFNEEFTIKMDLKTNYPTKMIYKVIVFKNKDGENKYFMEFDFIKNIITKYSKINYSVLSKNLPEAEKDKEIIAMYDGEVLYKENDKFFTNYVDEDEIKTEGYFITDKTSICKNIKEFEKILVNTPNDIQSYVESVKKMLSDYDIEGFSDKEIFDILNEDNMKELLIREDPESISDTAPREIILDEFEAIAERKY